MNHGWFEIDGLQTGEHKLERRLHGLTRLAQHAKGATILDLGCAEGLISAWLYDQGPACLVDGVEKHPLYLETANRLHIGNPAFRFFLCDVDEGFDNLLWSLLPSYDIVLCLCLAQKLRQPREFLIKAASLCTRYFALHLPEPLINDVRSQHVVVDPDKDVFEPLGFECVLHLRDAKLSRKIYQKEW